MDYSVGSIADLITGSNTPNKPKVRAKKVVTPKAVLTPSHSSEADGEETKSPKQKSGKKGLGKSPKAVTPFKQSPKPKKFKEKKSRKLVEESNDVEEETKPKKRAKKAPQNPVIDASGIIDSDAEEPTDEGSNSVQTTFEINAERRVMKKGKFSKPVFIEDAERLSRTILVKNIPVTTTKKAILKVFKKYGKVSCVRIRGASVGNLKVTKKVAIIRKELNPKRETFYAFVVYENRDDAVKATEANRTLFEGRHLMVVLCDDNDSNRDESKAIYLGNLPFNAEEEQLWKLFEVCGTISSIRIVRDSASGMGKGFGFVNFETSDAVQLALDMEDVKIGERVLRIKLCDIRAGKDKKRVKKEQKYQEKRDKGEGAGPRVRKSFQGSKFADKNNKKKFDKGLAQKKRMIKKLAPKADIAN